MTTSSDHLWIWVASVSGGALVLLCLCVHYIKAHPVHETAIMHAVYSGEQGIGGKMTSRQCSSLKRVRRKRAFRSVDFLGYTLPRALFRHFYTGGGQ